MLFQTSRHLWLQPHGEQTLVQNICSGRRALLTVGELESLESYCRPQEPQATPLFERLQDADLVVPQSEPLVSPREELLRLAVDKFLAGKLSLSRAKLVRTHPDAQTRVNLAQEMAEGVIKKESHLRDLRSLFSHYRTFMARDASSQQGYQFAPGFLSASRERPLPLEEFAQLPCMPHTTQERVLLAEPCLGAESRCLVLGDDDLIGLHWGLTRPQSCDVFELDQALLDFLQASDLGLSLHTRDLTEGLPAEFHGLYDVIYTDPMYTRAGWDMFAMCCSQGLSSSPRARVFLTTRPDLIEDGDLLEQRLAEVGLKILKRTPDFSRYNLPALTRRKALLELQRSGLSIQLLQGLMEIPYLYTEMLELGRVKDSAKPSKI